MDARTLDELRALEPIFHHATTGADAAAFESLTTPEFTEVGASGATYSREYVVAELVKRYSAPHEDVWAISDFRARRLAADLFLVTYTLDQSGRVTRRVTVWRATERGWSAEYHQGTLV